MKIDDFYKIVRQTALEAVDYTFPKGSFDRAIAYLGIGAAFGRTTREFMNRPFVRDALPKIRSLGIIDEAKENVDVEAVLSGLDVCVEQNVEIDLKTFTVDRKEFELLSQKLKGNKNHGQTGTAAHVGSAAE